ncbi:hypothetical protein OX462_07920 [Janthinobacterium sp. SUN098]|uniref:hypothetical protein n=1 Tax=Janthinobacterium TaxID=29580 RepID=UPI0011131BB6|nr:MULTISPECIES: hypothetical protein [Janthinobacterium]
MTAINEMGQAWRFLRAAGARPTVSRQNDVLWARHACGLRLKTTFGAKQSCSKTTILRPHYALKPRIAQLSRLLFQN